jgi:hypothetical protein
MAGPLVVHNGRDLVKVSDGSTVLSYGDTVPTGPGYPAGAVHVKSGASPGLYTNQGDVDGANYSQQEADSLFDSEYTIGRTTADPPELTARTLNSSNPARKNFLGISPIESKVLVDSSVAGTVPSPGTFITNSASTRHMEVSRVHIDGQGSAGEGTSVDHVTNGIELTGHNCRVERCLIENIDGNAIVLQDNQYAHDNVILGAINCIEVTSSDSHVTNHRDAAGFQNAGLLISSGGHTIVSGNHFYGGKYALYDGSSGGGTQSSGNTWADAHFGVYYHGDAHNGTFTGDRVQHCRTRGMYVAGDNMSCVNCLVDAQLQVDESGVDGITNSIGVEVLGDRFTYLGGKIELKDYSSGGHTNPIVANCALKVAGDNCRIVTRLIDFDGLSGSIGMRTSGAILGGYFEFDVFGFLHANDSLLVIDNAGLKACTFIFKGPDLDTATPGTHVTVPAAWKEAGSGNSITIINTTTGAQVELDNIAYP